MDASKDEWADETGCGWYKFAIPDANPVLPPQGGLQGHEGVS